MACICHLLNGIVFISELIGGLNNTTGWKLNGGVRDTSCLLAEHRQKSEAIWMGKGMG